MASQAGPLASASPGEPGPNSQKVQQQPLARTAVVTRLLVAACILIFAAMAFRQVSGHVNSEPLLLRWGANFGPLTLGGQWWRLLTSVFLHLGLVHLAVNMWCLWDLGTFAERIYGRAEFLVIYLVAGVAGGICTLYWHPFSVAAGASGAIFGLAGALVGSFVFDELPFPRKSAVIALLSVIAFAGYNLFVGFVSKGAGNAAHLGGFLSGFLLVLLISETSFRRALVVGVLSVVLGCVIVGWKERYVVTVEQGRNALAKGQSDKAIQAFSESIRRNPKSADTYKLLGEAYLQKKQLADAETAYRRAVALRPEDSSIRYQLGMVLLAQGRMNDASGIFNQMAAEDPRDFEAQMGIGTAAELAGNHQAAFDAFQRATQLAPKNPQACSNLGLAALQLNRADDAIAAFSKCTQLQPDNPKAMMNLAIAYEMKGMHKEAEESYRRAVELANKSKK